VKLKLEVKKKDLIWVGLIIVIVGIGLVVAYGGSQPTVVGHSLGEITMPSCSEGQVLKMSGGVWACGDGSSSGGINGCYVATRTGPGDIWCNEGYHLVGANSPEDAYEFSFSISNSRSGTFAGVTNNRVVQVKCCK